MTATHELEVTPKRYHHYERLTSSQEICSDSGTPVVAKTHHLLNCWNHISKVNADQRSSLLFFLEAVNCNMRLPTILAKIIWQPSMPLIVCVCNFCLTTRRMLNDCIAKHLRDFVLPFDLKYSETFVEHLLTPNKPMYYVP